MRISAKINAIGFDGVDVKPEEIAVAIEKAAGEVGKIAAQKIAMKRRELERLKEEVNRLLDKLNAKLGDEKVDIAVNVVKNEPISISSPRPLRPPRPVSESNGDLSGSQIKILSRLVELLECTGDPSVSKEQLAAWSEYSPNSGGYNNYLGSLRSAGMIEYPSGGMVTITDEGRKHAQPGDVPVDNSEMLERAKRVLGGSEGKLLEILHEKRDTVGKIELAEAAGFSPNSGGFNNYLGHMRTLGFIDYPAPGKVRCSDWMYVA